MALDLWDSAVGAPEVPVNALFVAASHILTYANRARTTSGLSWGYIGGRYSGVLFDDGVLTLTDDDDNYIVAPLDGGVPTVAITTTNWDDSANYGRCYKVTTVAGLVTAIEDHRGGALGISGGSGGGGGGAQTVKVVATTGYTFLEDDNGKLIYFTGADGTNLELPDNMPALWSVDVQNQSPASFVIEVTGGSPLGLINGGADLAFDIGQGAHITSDGTDFFAETGMAGYSAPTPAYAAPVMLVIGDETTALTTGTAKFRYRQQGDNSIIAVKASLNVAQASGAQLVTVDVKINGVSIFTTLLTIDNTERTSKTAAVPAVIDIFSANLVDDDEVQIDVTVQGGSVAAGLKVYLMEYVQNV